MDLSNEIPEEIKSMSHEELLAHIEKERAAITAFFRDELFGPNGRFVETTPNQTAHNLMGIMGLAYTPPFAGDPVYVDEIARIVETFLIEFTRFLCDPQRMMQQKMHCMALRAQAEEAANSEPEKGN